MTNLHLANGLLAVHNIYYSKNMCVCFIGVIGTIAVVSKVLHYILQKFTFYDICLTCKISFRTIYSWCFTS